MNERTLLGDALRNAATKVTFGPARRLGKDEAVVIRFAGEMDDTSCWAFLHSEFDQEASRTLYAIDEDELGEPRPAFFAVAWSNDTQELEVWELRKSLVAKFVEYEEEYKTLTDRAYKIRRKGEGLNTEYSATPVNIKLSAKKIRAAHLEDPEILTDALDKLLDADD